MVRLDNKDLRLKHLPLRSFRAKLAGCENQGVIRKRSYSSTKQALGDELAIKVLGWKVTPDRYFASDRSWLPKWRFQPLTRIEDALRLLEASGGTYQIASPRPKSFQVAVTIDGTTGAAVGNQLPYAISIAIARAIGLISEQEVRLA